jgi:hypothetical protein
MASQPCWCSTGMCHRCNHKRQRLFLCIGCGHRFCFCCAHRLETRWACVECATTWLNVMCSLDVPPFVTSWLNAVTLCEPE